MLEAGKERKGIFGALQEKRAACQALWGRGTPGAAGAGSQEDCQEWVEVGGQVVGQEGRPGEAGGAGVQDKGSGGSQEPEQYAPELEVEVGEEEGRWVQDLGQKGSEGQLVTKEERGRRGTEDWLDRRGCIPDHLIYNGGENRPEKKPNIKLLLVQASSPPQ